MVEGREREIVNNSKVFFSNLSNLVQGKVSLTMAVVGLESDDL